MNKGYFDIYVLVNGNGAYRDLKEFACVLFQSGIAKEIPFDEDNFVQQMEFYEIMRQPVIRLGKMPAKPGTQIILDIHCMVFFPTGITIIYRFCISGQTR